MFSCSHFGNFLSDRKAERHVKERSRSDFPWGFTDGKAKTNGPSDGEISQLGVTQLVEREGKSSARLGTSGQSGERRWRTRWSYRHKEICADHSKSQNRKVSGDRKKAHCSDSWKQFDQKESSNSTRTRRIVRPATPRPEFQNRQYTNHQCVTKIFHLQQKNQGITEGYSTFSMEAFKTKLCSYGECSCLRQWKQPFILDRITWRTWRPTRTRTSRKFRAHSILHRNWYWSILKKFWMWIGLTVHLCLTIKWSSGQAKVRGYSDSVQCLGRMTDSKDAITTWEGQVEEFKLSSLLQRITGNRWRSNLIWVEYFRRIFVIADSSRIQNDVRSPNLHQRRVPMLCMVVLWNLTKPQGNEDRIAGKGFTSMIHDNLVHKLILMHQATKTPDAKAAVDKELARFDTIPSRELEKVKSKKEVILEAQRNKRKVHFDTLLDICHSKNAE